MPEPARSLHHFGQTPVVCFQPHQDYGLLLWNIYKGKKTAWQGDFARLHVLYDVLLLQEAKLHLETGLPEGYDPGYHWVFGESFTLARGGHSCGVLTGSRIQADSVFNRHGPIPEPLLKTPKSAVFAYYPLAQSALKLLIVNAHLINFRSTRAFYLHLEQITDLLSGHEGPVLFAGDFNTWNPTRLKILADAMLSVGLSQVVFRNEKRRFLLLDHIFIRQIEIREALLLHDIKSSDHIPLSIWFRITPL